MSYIFYRVQSIHSLFCEITKLPIWEDCDMVQFDLNQTTLVQEPIQGQTIFKGIHIRLGESIHIKIYAETPFDMSSYVIYRPTTSQSLYILVKDSNLDKLAPETRL